MAKIMELLGELGGHTHQSIGIVEQIDKAIEEARAGADKLDDTLKRRDELAEQVSTLAAQKAEMEREIAALAQTIKQMENDKEAFLTKFRS